MGENVNPNTSAPEPIDAKVSIKISPDKKKASIIMIAPKNEGRAPTRADIENAIEAAGIKFGIAEDLIRSLAAIPVYDKTEVIAAAELPQRGEDGRIEFHFKTTRDRVPRVLPDGSVDFKDLGIVENVKTGDVLCTKIPPTPGIPGTDVTGEPIPPTPGKEARMPRGTNTQISEDGSTLLAVTDGQVDLVNERVEVKSSFEVSGDVGVATGNIEFIGNVLIKGSVSQGFQVTAEGNIAVMGEVTGAVIKAGGNVFIENGINGMNSCTVEAGGDVRCKYVQNATVTAGYNIESGMCVNSTLKAGAAIKIMGKSARIIASDLTARHTIDCVNVGTDTASRATSLSVGQDPQTMERYKEIPKENDKLQKDIAKVEQLIELFTKLHQQGRLDEEKQKELKKLTLLRTALQTNLVELLQEKQDVDQRLLTAGYGNINITGTAYPDVLLTIGTERRLLKTIYKYTLFTREHEGIVAGASK